MSDMITTLAFYMRFPFVRYALIVGVLIALCSSLLGVTLVLKRFSYIGDGLSHVAFGAMAVAAVDTILQNFRDFNRKPSDYDRIITGDLGMVGKEILLDFMREAGQDISSIHMDCGIEMFDPKTQDTHSGGSGCGCSAAVLCGYILPKIQAGEWKRVLFVPTGALLSQISFNEGQNVPGIAHGVVLEGKESFGE